MPQIFIHYIVVIVTVNSLQKLPFSKINFLFLKLVIQLIYDDHRNLPAWQFVLTQNFFWVCLSTKKFSSLTCEVLMVALSTWTPAHPPAILLLSAHNARKYNLCLPGSFGQELEHAVIEQTGKYYWSVVCKGPRNQRSFLSCRRSCLHPPILLKGTGTKAVLAKISSSSLCRPTFFPFPTL